MFSKVYKTNLERLKDYQEKNEKTDNMFVCVAKRKATLA